MIAERTEQEALDGILLLHLGREPVQLRTLDIEESDVWLGKLAADVAAIDVPIEDDAPPDAFKRFLTQSAEAVLVLIAEYDVEGVLGGVEGIRARKPTKRQLRVAIEEMVSAEDPFGEDAVRSVVTAFGEPSRALWGLVRTVVGGAASLQGLSTDGHSAGSDSATATSDAAGPESSSSSAGPIPITSSKRKRKSA